MVESADTALKITDVARVAADEVAGISVAFLVCGSGVTAERAALGVDQVPGGRRGRRDRLRPREHSRDCAASPASACSRSATSKTSSVRSPDRRRHSEVTSEGRVRRRQHPAAVGRDGGSIHRAVADLPQRRHHRGAGRRARVPVRRSRSSAPCFRWSAPVVLGATFLAFVDLRRAGRGALRGHPRRSPVGQRPRRPLLGGRPRLEAAAHHLAAGRQLPGASGALLRARSGR